MIYDSLVALLLRLHAVGGRDDDYVLFGSTVLHLHGVQTGRPVGDIDVFVRRRVWGQLFANPATKVVTPRADDPPFLEIDARPPLHVFYAWTTRDREWMDVDRCFRLAEFVRGYRCVPLAEVRRHKALAETTGRDQATREKHESDLAAIDERLSA